MRLYENTFLAACLLHDCAHAPFSHTFEHYYEKAQDLGGLLLELMKDDPSFQEDYKGEHTDQVSAPHEKASAIVLLRHYKDAVSALGGDPLLAARMIIGCEYHQCGEDDGKHFGNALISLLNGKAIDVDKLDYVVRDSWASGFNNASVDIDRLLSAVCVRKAEWGSLVVAFKRNALSVIQDVVDARNRLYRWIYAHHKVTYDQHLLEKCVIGAAEHMDANKSADETLVELFSLDLFDECKPIGDFRFFLVSDADLIHAIKCTRDKVGEAEQWLSRRHTHKAVWKTWAEFDYFFPEIETEDVNAMLSQLDKGLLDKFGENLLYKPVLFKAKSLKRNALLIDFAGDIGLLAYNDFFKQPGSDASAQATFFYIYAPTGSTINARDLAAFLKKNK